MIQLRQAIVSLCLVGICHAQTFFPDVLFESEAGLNQLHIKWYSDALRALKEPQMVSLRSGIIESYRLTWLRTSDRPIALRIDVSRDGLATFFLKVTDGKGGYDPGQIIRNEKWLIEDPKLKAFKEAFTNAAFFEHKTGEETTGIDGSRWLVEANVNGRYHVISRWSPQTGPAREIGMALIKIAVADFASIY